MNLHHTEPQRVGDMMATLVLNLAIEWTSVAVGERWPVLRRGEREPVNRLTRRLIYLRDGHRCRLCHRRGLLELDHIVPWSAGGPDTSENLRSLCGGCNSARSNFRTESDLPAVPVTVACDPCINRWVTQFGVARYGHCIPGAQLVTAFCGNCRDFSVVTDPDRLR